MKAVNISSVDEYIAMFPGDTQKILHQVREKIKKMVPGSGEKISYGIPTVTLNDTYLIYFAGFKKHISLYPAPRGAAEFKKELSQYKGGKGTVQFPLDKPIPFDLIARIVKFRLKESDQKARNKKSQVAMNKK